MQFTEWACGGPDIIRDAGPVPDGPRLDIRDAVRKRHSASPMYTAYTWDVKTGDVIEVDHTAPVYFVAKADGEASVYIYPCDWPSCCKNLKQIGKVYG